VKKIVSLSIAIVVLLALVGGGTWALFSDTETSTGNQFTAGIIDLEIDSDGDTTFSAQDDPLPKIFEYLPANDIKPGDNGEVTLSLHLKTDSNNADLWMQVQSLANVGGLNPEPEQEAESGGVDDDIAAEILVTLWVDEGAIAGWQGTGEDTTEGDNIYQATDEDILYDGTLSGLTAAGVSGKISVWEDAQASQTIYVGWTWELPSTVGNEHQGDICTFDIVFGADQIVP